MKAYVPLAADGGVLEGAVVGLAGALGHPGLDLGHGSLLELVDDVEGVGRVAGAGGYEPGAGRDGLAWGECSRLEALLFEGPCPGSEEQGQAHNSLDSAHVDV